MNANAGRRVAIRRHADSRLFLEITLVMIFLMLLTYAPMTKQSSYTETENAPGRQQQQEKTSSGKEAWLHLAPSGLLVIDGQQDKARQDWPAVHAYLKQKNIGVVVLNPESDVPFAVVAKVWQQALQAGEVVRVTTAK